MSAKSWPEEDIQYLREHYPTGDLHQLAEHYGITLSSLYNAAARYGIKREGFYYTKEEEELIQEWFGTYSAATIACKLGKTLGSVTSKINSMGLGRMTDNTDNLCLLEASRLVGRNYVTLRRYWTADGLKIKRRGNYLMIEQKDLAKFMKAHPERWDATKCDKDYFCVYPWFQEKLLADRQKAIDKRWANAGRFKAV